MTRNLKNIPSYIIVDDLEDDTHTLTPEQIAFWHNEILNKMKKKIYIAGKVTGLPQQEVVDKFAKAQKVIEEMGFEVINPIVVVNDFNTPWNVAMKMCLTALFDCSGIVMLPCWEDSKGARIEKELASSLGFELLYLEKWNN